MRQSFANVIKKATKRAPICVVLILEMAVTQLDCQTLPSGATLKNTSSGQSLQIGAARLRININGPVPELSEAALQHHVVEAAQAVVIYYGRFPVASARVILSISTDRHGVLQGTTWGKRDGFPAATRLRIGQGTTQPELDSDWIATHELVHMALASLAASQHWLEEGIATYVEPVARVQAGQLTAQCIWADMMARMAHGEPQAGDLGLDRTHTWGRTYWGGALFCLIADVEIRKQTGNKRGLQDALRGIVRAGGTIDKDWHIERVLRIGDQATGTTVLEDLYRKWSVAPVEVDLAKPVESIGHQSSGWQCNLHRRRTSRRGEERNHHNATSVEARRRTQQTIVCPEKKACILCRPYRSHVGNR
jgi:hypothetical protein